MEYLSAIARENCYVGQHPSAALLRCLLAPFGLLGMGCEVSLCRAAYAGLPGSDRCTSYRPLIFVALRQESPLLAQHPPPREALAPLRCLTASRGRAPFDEHASTHPAIWILFAGRQICSCRRWESIA